MAERALESQLLSRLLSLRFLEELFLNKNVRLKNSKKLKTSRLRRAFIYLFSDFVQSTRCIKQKDTSPLQGFST